MRVLVYVLIFLDVSLILLLNVLSTTRPDWLVVKSQEVLNTRITLYYGLFERCQYTLTRIPNPSGSGKIEYSDYSCRPFPTSESDGCDEEYREFCFAWTTARYSSVAAIGFGGVTLLATLFGMLTQSTRRRVWKTLVLLVFSQALLQIVTFGIVTDLSRTTNYPTFEYARPGAAYITNVLSWVIGVLLTWIVLIVGIAASEGYRWAAGGRAYHPIPG